MKVLLFTIMSIFVSLESNIDTLKNYKIDDSKVFNGVQLDTTFFVGEIVDKNFCRTKGFFDECFNPLYVRTVEGFSCDNNDTTYYNYEELNIRHSRQIGKIDGDYVIAYWNSLREQNIFVKRFNSHENKWLIYHNLERKDHSTETISSFSYDSSGDISLDNRLLENIFHVFIVVWGLFIVFRGSLWVLALFYLFNKGEIKNEERVGIILAILGVLALVSFYLFFDYFLRCQIVNAILIVTIPFVIALLLKKEILYFILGPVLLIGLLGYTFVYTSETVAMGDGTPITINWKPGTDVVKRAYLKRIINNMVPVEVSAPTASEGEGKDYLLYFNKYEFCQRDYDVLIDETLNWFSGKWPKVDMSYRECRVIIDKFFDLTGIRFDIPTIHEWECAKGDAVPEYISYRDYYFVKKGIANEYGLYNINANAPEYTSNYFSMNYRISMDAETIAPSYDFVWISGIVDQDTNTMDVIYKTAKSFDHNPTFRLVYRPNGIGARRFIINGVLRNDVGCDTLPANIILLTLNGERVCDIPDYETFEELVVESRYDKKQLMVIDERMQSERSLTLPKGTELYDFYPKFVFDGLW